MSTGGKDHYGGSSPRWQALYRQLTQLVLNPSVGEPRAATYASLSRDALCDLRTDAAVTPEKIRLHIEEKFGFSSVPLQLIDEGLAVLRHASELAETDQGISLNDEALRRLDHERKEVTRVFDAMLGFFAEAVAKEAGFGLDRYQLRFVHEAFEQGLFRILESVSTNALGFLKVSKEVADLVPIRDAIRDAGLDPRYDAIERVSDLRRALVPALVRVFTSPTEEFSLGLLQTSTKHVMFRVLGADASLHELRRELFRDVAFLIDTNIVVSALCVHSYRHNETISLLDAMASVGVGLLVSEYTLSEFATAVHYADFLHAKTYRREVDVRLVDNEIARNFYDSRRHPTEWPAYVKELTGGIHKLLEDRKGKVVSATDYLIDQKQVDALRGLYRELEREPYDRKPESLLIHDARNILLVQEMRRLSGPRPFQSPWFVSHDAGLRRLDGLAQKRMGLVGQTVLSLGAAFELIYPFIWSEIGPGQAAAVFTKIVASSVLPIPPPSASSFVNYVAVELELPIDQETAIRRVVESHSLRRALEYDLEQGDTAGALGKLSAMFTEAVPSLAREEERKKLIDRLALRLQEYQGKEPYEFVSFQESRWQTGLKAVSQARTNDEKKKSLEEFADLLVAQIRGLRVIRSDLRSAAEEVDRLVANDWRPNWGDPILIECKNWATPVGAKEINDFAAKIATYSARTGLLLATTGITGDRYHDARQRLRDYLKDGTHIVCVSYVELLGVKNGKDLFSLLERRWYVPWD